MEKQLGFSLIELMIAVAIIGLLAVVAVSSLDRYVRRARSAEALISLRKLSDGVQAYYSAEHAAADGSIQPAQFPNANAGQGWTPTLGVCCAQIGQKCAPYIWDQVLAGDPVGQAYFNAATFGLSDPFYYSVAALAGRASASAATAGDYMTPSTGGDLNCNGIYGLFYRRLQVQSDLSVRGDAVYQVNPTE